MNKQEAAEFVGIAPRTLEYHVKQGNVGVRYERGPTGDQAVFDESELSALMAKIDA